MSEDDDLRQALHTVWIRRRAGVLERLAVVEDAFADALEGTLGDDARRDGERAAHQIAGSVGTFGFDGASERARELEHALRAGVPPVSDLLRLTTLLAEIRAEIEQDPVPDEPAEDPPDDAAGAADVVLVGGPEDRAARIGDALLRLGLRASWAPGLADGLERAEAAGTSVALVDVDVPEGHAAALEAVAELAAELPVLVVDRTGAVARDDVTEAGARGPLPADLDVPGTAAALAALRHRTSLSGAVVLVRDPQTERRDRVAQALRESGMAVEVDPAQDDVRFALARTRPELVVLAAPRGDGAGEVIVACRRVRNDPRWSALPVVILADEGAPGAAAAYLAGADDHLDGPRGVAARVGNRLVRSRSLAAASEPDAPVPAGAGGAPAPGAPGPEAAGAEDAVDVVVVEDDPAIVALLVHALEGRGLTVRPFGDGLEAVRVLTDPDAPLAARVVLLDWDLPGIDGLRVLRSLGRAGVLARTRVVMLTARAGESEVLEALEAGASDHVAKPFSLPVLLQRVRGAMVR